MDKNETAKRVIKCKLKVIRSKLSLRWIDGVGEDLRELGIRGWWMIARNMKSCMEEGSRGSKRALGIL